MKEAVNLKEYEKTAMRAYIMKKLGIGATVIGMIILVMGVIMKLKKAVSVSIIGGADGPTSVFVAGQLGGGLGVSVIGLGIILLIIGLVLIMKHKRK